MELDKERMDELFSGVIALVLFLSLPQVMSDWAFRFMATIHRVTRPQIFKLPYDLHYLILLFCVIQLGFGYYLDKKSALIAALVPLLIVLVGGPKSVSVFGGVLSVFQLFYFKKGRQVTKWGLRIGTVLYVPILLHWTIFKLFDLPGVLLDLVAIETGLFYIFSLINPVMVIGFYFLWIIKLVLKREISTSKSLIWGNDQTGSLLLGLSIVVVVFSSVYPYFSSINPDFRMVGVDAPRYIQSLNTVSEDVSKIFVSAWGSRPLLLFLLYFVKQVTGWSSPFVVKVFPMFIFPVLIFSVFHLSKVLGLDSASAGLASFLTATGMNLTVGLYSHFLANILALALANGMIISFIKAYKEDNTRYLFSSILFSILLNLSHPYTFIQYTGILFLAVLYYRFIGKNQNNRVVDYVFFGTLILVEVLKTWLVVGLSGGNISDTAVGKVIWFSRFWWNTFFSNQILYGGYLSNISVILLAIVGLYFIGFDSFEKIFLNFLVITPSMLYLIGNETIKGRLLYNTPLGVFAAFGVSFLSSKYKIQKDLLVMLVMYSLVVLFRSLANLV
jgi:hypothetical protein